MHNIFDCDTEIRQTSAQLCYSTGAIIQRYIESMDWRKQILINVICQFLFLNHFTLYLSSLPSDARPRSRHLPNVVVSMFPPHKSSTTLKWNTIKLNTKAVLIFKSID